ncbi:MAG TPA: MarR family winged helix-turn-helix transcriptional regulator [Solirubrobacteraceae bacterium]|nr:MarR family winged helix-turn-helix transcriptional regulator [Solirubrobacteraceae bacterium]
MGSRQIIDSVGRVAEILGNILLMSTPPRLSNLGLPDHEAAALGDDGATRIRLFRIILLLAQELRTLMDQLLREDRLTTQQAALITIVDTLDQPSMKQAAAGLGTTHQNIKQLASSLARKGFIRFLEDPTDARVRRLATTAKSHSTWQRRSADDQERVLEWFSELSTAEAQTLFELLLKLQTGLHATLPSPREASTTSQS